MIKQQQKEFEKEKRTRKERKAKKKLDIITVNKYKQMVYVLEKDHEDMQTCHANFKSHNPLVPYVKLFCGFIGSLLSLLWLLHIILYMTTDPPIDTFLNSYFMWFDKWFPLFGTLSVLVFSLYLLACVAKGCFKFGVRCFCFALHPMAYGGTMMNSFLFNLSLILMATIPVVQFSSQAFADYARLTEIENMFGAQIKHLVFFKYFFENNIFVYIFFAMSLATLVYLIFYPADKPASPSELRSKLTVRGEEREMRQLVEQSGGVTAGCLEMTSRNNPQSSI
jgi:LMBR1 domain-containing protein 1